MFKVIEVGFDATKLRQDEAEVVKLCGDTDVFIPSKTIKVSNFCKTTLIYDRNF